MTGNFIPGGTVWGIWQGKIYSQVVQFVTENLVVTADDYALNKARLFLTKEQAMDALLQGDSYDHPMDSNINATYE